MSTSYFRYDTWVKTALGPAVPGAQVYVCTQPANTNSAPPSPLASIFADPNGLVPITQPIITDGFGHADFYAQAGVYTVIVANGGVIQQVYTDQSLGGVGSQGTGLLLQSNGVNNPNQVLFDLYSSDGTVIITPDVNGDGGVNLQSVASNRFANPGYGGFISTGFPIQSNNAAGLTNAGLLTTAGNVNEVTVFEFDLQSTYTVSDLYAYFQAANGASGFVAFGIYSTAGVKLIDSGPLACSNTQNASVIGGAVARTTLTPNTYYFAATTSNALFTLVCFSEPPVQTIALLNFAGSVKTGVAVNTSVNGQLPSTLGGIVAQTSSNYGYMPMVLFAV